MHFSLMKLQLKQFFYVYFRAYFCNSWLMGSTVCAAGSSLDWGGKEQYRQDCLRFNGWCSFLELGCWGFTTVWERLACMSHPAPPLS
mmetsp:Transcript_9638/g.23038  ORF Transcript_9638/g.23038 Transcript_9638/m.23038 type:complete len:87 (+) Transcript_9638:1111-1371(+)